jgi:hypothetical protein
MSWLFVCAPAAFLVVFGLIFMQQIALQIQAALP